MLGQLRRGHSVQEAIDAVGHIANAGFTPKVDFIFGLPGETDRQRAASRRLIEHLTATYGAKIHAHTFVPLPASALAAARPTVIDELTKELIHALRGQGRATGAWARGDPNCP